MNTTKIQFQIEDSNPECNPNYGGALAQLLPRQNGTPAGVGALAASLERSKHLTAPKSNVKEINSHV